MNSKLDHSYKLGAEFSRLDSRDKFYERLLLIATEWDLRWAVWIMGFIDTLGDEDCVNKEDIIQFYRELKCQL